MIHIIIVEVDMKKLLILVVSIPLFSLNSHADPINSINEFERKIEGCLTNFSSKNKCIGEHIKKHLPPGNESIMPVADQVVEIFVKWLGTDKVENVYPVQRKKIGEFIINQDYIVEDSSASIMLFEITYRKVLGKWYVFNFNINSKQEYIRDRIGF
jgi:hypothetical protein